MNSILKRVARLTPKPLKSLAHSVLQHRNGLRHLFRHNLRAAATWRGDNPRVYLHNAHSFVRSHSIWRTYITHPPLRYAPYPIADLYHWINPYPIAELYRYAHTVPRCLRKPNIFEIEHVFMLVGGDVEDWHYIANSQEVINQRVGLEHCHTVFTFSAGLVEHFKQFVQPEFWSKLDYVYPAYPAQPEQERTGLQPFTMLVIASRFSDKGIPEAMRAYEVLRARHGAGVRMLLVSQAVPTGYRLPEGVVHYDTPRMDEDLKSQLYQAADVLLLPCYSETAACFPEAYAFGVPVVTTRIHHGDEFVREGVTGYLLRTPAFPYSEGFGSRWKSWKNFLSDLEAMRERGELHGIVDDMVDRLEVMIRGGIDVASMRRAARAFHAEQFSPEARNRKLLFLYAAALENQ